MEISISNLYSRFNFFSYSTFQKYKKDKCENKPFFSCKKDFYQYLEIMYQLEFKSRKKLFNIFEEKDFLILSLIFDKNNSIENLENLSVNILNQLLKESQLISPFDIDNFHIGQPISYQEKIELFFQIYNNINALKQKDWSDFDEFIFFQILDNLKRFYNLKNNYTNIFDISNISKNIITIFPNSSNNKDNYFEETKLIFNFKENLIEIYEEEEINSKIKKTKLKEPKWLFKNRFNKYSFMDHKFNFLTIDKEEKKIFYNGISILGSNKLFPSQHSNYIIKIINNSY